MKIAVKDSATFGLKTIELNLVGRLGSPLVVHNFAENQDKKFAISNKRRPRK